MSVRRKVAAAARAEKRSGQRQVAARAKQKRADQDRLRRNAVYEARMHLHIRTRAKDWKIDSYQIIYDSDDYGPHTSTYEYAWLVVEGVTLYEFYSQGWGLTLNPPPQRGVGDGRPRISATEFAEALRAAGH